MLGWIAGWGGWGGGEIWLLKRTWLRVVGVCGRRGGPGGRSRGG